MSPVSVFSSEIALERIGKMLNPPIFFFFFFSRGERKGKERKGSKELEREQQKRTKKKKKKKSGRRIRFYPLIFLALKKISFIWGFIH